MVVGERMRKDCACEPKFWISADGDWISDAKYERFGIGGEQ